MRYRPSYVSRQSGAEKISRATIATAPTMALDSSGTCEGERRMSVGKCARRLWLECVTSNPMDIADNLGHRFWRLIPDSRQSTPNTNGRYSHPRFIMNSSNRSTNHTLPVPHLLRVGLLGYTRYKLHALF